MTKMKLESNGNWSVEDYEIIISRLQDGLKDIVEIEVQKEGSGNILLISHD